MLNSFLKTGVPWLLEGREIEALVKRMRGYKKVERHRPKVTRKESTEVFSSGLQKNLRNTRMIGLLDRNRRRVHVLGRIILTRITGLHRSAAL